MRVGIDYLPARTHAPGLGRFARELVRALVRLELQRDDPEFDLRLLEFGGAQRVLPDSALGLSPPAGRSSPIRCHRRSRLPRRLTGPLLGAIGTERWLGGCDVFQAIVPGWPPLRTATSFLTYSELPLERELDAQRAVVESTDHLLCFSTESHELLTSDLGRAADCVHQVPVGCEHWRRELSSVGPPPEPLTVLALGAVDGHRAHESLLAAFESLLERGRAQRLLLIGRRGAEAERFEGRLRFSSARSHVEWIDQPRESSMPSHVAESAVLVHLGARDATPVTPLEVMAFGRPVVAADRPVYREALGEHASFVAATRPRDLVPELIAALEASIESAFDASATSAREAHAARFTWATTARAVLASWSRAVAG